MSVRQCVRQCRKDFPHLCCLVLEREVPLLSLLDVWPSHRPQVLGMACREKQHLTQRDTSIFFNILWRKIFDYKSLHFVVFPTRTSKNFCIKIFLCKTCSLSPNLWKWENGHIAGFNCLNYLIS